MRLIVTTSERVFCAFFASRRAHGTVLASTIFGSLSMAFVSSACSEPVYVCTNNAQCLSPSGAQGTCETTGYCAYPDIACIGSTERYSESAGGGLANACVATPSTNCIEQLAVGLDFSCYVRTDGTVWCWGKNSNGQLGDGTTTNRSSPTQVLINNPVVEVQVGESHACVELAADGGIPGSIYCWGSNGQTNLGQCKSASELNESPSPLPIFYATVDGGTAGEGGAGANWTCDKAKPLFAAIPSASNAYRNTLSVGGEHTCVIDVNGSLLCWGENTSNTPFGGQAGQDFTLYPVVEGPLVVTGSATLMTQQPIISVEVGAEYSCLLNMDGNVYCWGSNQYDELAAADSSLSSPSPVPISPLSSVDSLITDDQTACALSSGTMSCWGNGTTGIFGPATPPNPKDNVPMPFEVATATAVYGGPESNTVFIEAPSGAIECWGANNKGQCAIGTSAVTNVTSPTPALLSSVAQLVIGADHGCALTKAGELFCWGDNTYGELGTGTTSVTPNPIPTRVPVRCN